MNSMNVYPFNIFTTLFMLVWIAIAMSNAINPRFMWKITESWKATKEPQDSNFMIRRVAGSVFNTLVCIYTTVIVIDGLNDEIGHCDVAIVLGNNVELDGRPSE